MILRQLKIKVSKGANPIDRIENEIKSYECSCLANCLDSYESVFGVKDDSYLGIYSLSIDKILLKNVYCVGTFLHSR